MEIMQNLPVYENLWNDDVRPNLWTIFKVDHKLILYLKCNGCIFGKVWFTSWYLPGGTLVDEGRSNVVIEFLFHL